ncbi:MAG: thioredoxin domain-containing protein [Candidatus Micrarchaeia archaeon]
MAKTRKSAKGRRITGRRISREIPSSAQSSGLQATNPSSSESSPSFGTLIIVAALILAAVFFIIYGMLGGNAGQTKATVISGMPPELLEKAELAKNPEIRANGSAAGVKPAAQPLSGKEVVVDFLYADWCGYCSKMKPIVAKVASEMPPGRFEIRYWNENARGTNSTVAGIYSDYSAKGYFKGYPTFVANWNSTFAGAVPESEFRAWVCGQFSLPIPDACG